MSPGRTSHKKVKQPTDYIKVAGKWKYLYWAVDRAGDTVDFLLPAKRDKAAARRFLEGAINRHSVPEKLTIDKSGANTAAIESLKVDAFVDILRRQNKYLNTRVRHQIAQLIDSYRARFKLATTKGPTGRLASVF